MIGKIMSMTKYSTKNINKIWVYIDKKSRSTWLGK